MDDDENDYNLRNRQSYLNNLLSITGRPFSYRKYRITTDMVNKSDNLQKDTFPKYLWEHESYNTIYREGISRLIPVKFSSKIITFTDQRPSCHINDFCEQST